MRRRDLFSGFGYSLIVHGADLPPAQTRPDDIRKAMDAVVPRDPKPRRAGPEPNMPVVDLSTDVLVAGGGLAGVCAAISAARNGARVILLQDRSRLGGNSSSEVKMHVVGANSHRGRPGWREGGLIEEFRLDDAANNPQRCWELWDLLLYDKVVSEPNITLLLETRSYSADDEERSHSPRSLARCDKSEHLYRIAAKIFMRLHRRQPPRRSKPARSCAPDAKRAPSSANRSRPKTPTTTRSAAASCLPPGCSISRCRTRRRRGRARSRGSTCAFRDVGPHNWEYGYWWIEWGGDKDIIRDNERIRFELLSIVTGVWDYIKNSGEYPGQRELGDGLGRHDAREARQPAACGRRT